MADPALTSLPTGACRTQRVVLGDGERTWTVLDGDHRVVEPAEQYLEYLRMLGRSPNTVKSYARGLALWWEFLAVYDLAWDEVTVEDFGRFLGWLRTGDSPSLVSIERRPARFSEGTVALRVQAVCSFYRYHHYNGVETASRLYERVLSRGRAYKPMLEHIARRRGYERSVVRVSRPRPATPPTLTPEQVGLILDACAQWDPVARDWKGSVRDRLLWALLAESGMRLGEALALQHRDWHTGLGDTPFVEVVPREDHPHGLRVKNGGFRRIYISDELDRLYGEYLWRLCDAGADQAVDDLDCWWVFVNLAARAAVCAVAGGDGRVAGPPAAPSAGGPGAGGVHAALAAAHARDRAVDVGDRRACRQPPPRASGHPDDAEPVWVGVGGRRAAHGRAVAAADRRLEDG